MEENSERDDRAENEREHHCGEPERRPEKPAYAERELDVPEPHPSAAGDEPERKNGKRGGGARERVSEQIETPGNAEQGGGERQPGERVDPRVGNERRAEIVERDRDEERDYRQGNERIGNERRERGPVEGEQRSRQRLDDRVLQGYRPAARRATP